VLTRGTLRDFALDHFPELERAESAFTALCEGEVGAIDDTYDDNADSTSHTSADQTLQNAAATCPVLNLPDHAQPGVHSDSIGCTCVNALHPSSGTPL
jgi:hypothetical protein